MSSIHTNELWQNLSGRVACLTEKFRESQVKIGISGWRSKMHSIKHIQVLEFQLPALRPRKEIEGLVERRQLHRELVGSVEEEEAAAEV